MQLINGDCLIQMRGFEDNSFDTIVTDPPYGISFMGADWDNGVPGSHFWEEMLRIAKPGATLLAMSSTRTYHRLASAIEDAGWYVHDMISWVHSQGFPKAYDIAKGINARMSIGTAQPQALRKARMGEDYEPTGQKDYRKGRMFESLPSDNTEEELCPEAQPWNGYKTCLKPAFEPICVAQKPREGTYVENALKYGVAGFNIGGSKIPTADSITINTFDDGAKPFGDGAGHKYSSREETDGRYPSNFIHDGSEEVLDLFPNTGKSRKTYNTKRKARSKDGVFNDKNNGLQNGNTDEEGYDDEGSAARFFYCAKPSIREKNEGLDDCEYQLKDDTPKEIVNEIIQVLTL